MSSPHDGSASFGEFERWLAEARQGSSEALGRLVEVCRPYLNWLAKRIMPAHLQDKAGPSDLVAETVVKALSGFPDFRGSSEGELRGWLRVILLHTTADLIQHYETAGREVGREVRMEGVREAGLEPSAGDDSPSSQVGAAEDSERLRAAMQLLPAAQQEILRLHQVEGLGFEEVGRRLGCTARTARRRWARAVEALIKLLRSPNDQHRADGTGR